MMVFIWKGSNQEEKVTITSLTFQRGVVSEVYCSWFFVSNQFHVYRYVIQSLPTGSLIGLLLRDSMFGSAEYLLGFPRICFMIILLLPLKLS